MTSSKKKTSPAYYDPDYERNYMSPAAAARAESVFVYFFRIIREETTSQISLIFLSTQEQSLRYCSRSLGSSAEWSSNITTSGRSFHT